MKVNVTNLRKKVMLSLLAIIFSIGSIYASGDDAIIIIDDLSSDIKIETKTNSTVAVENIYVVNILNPQQLNMTFGSNSCNENYTNCDFFIADSYFEDNTVYSITLTMSDGSSKQKSFLFRK